MILQFHIALVTIVCMGSFSDLSREIQLQKHQMECPDFFKQKKTKRIYLFRGCISLCAWLSYIIRTSRPLMVSWLLQIPNTRRGENGQVKLEKERVCGGVASGRSKDAYLLRENSGGATGFT
jgi:hypothetical protein